MKLALTKSFRSAKLSFSLLDKFSAHAIQFLCIKEGVQKHFASIRLSVSENHNLNCRFTQTQSIYFNRNTTLLEKREKPHQLS